MPATGSKNTPEYLAVIAAAVTVAQTQNRNRLGLLKYQAVVAIPNVPNKAKLASAVAREPCASNVGEKAAKVAPNTAVVNPCRR